MIRMTIDGVTATATEKEVLTAGRVGLRCAFEFVGGEWGDLFKTAVFQGIETVDVALPTNECVVPWEAMAVEGVQLKVGVYGANGDGDIVIPTVWANFGKIQPSAVPSGVDPATPSQNANAYAVETAEQALAIAQSVRTDADNGVFDGEDGEGVPTGGTANQWLKKVSSTDYDTTWDDLPVEYFDCEYGTTTFAEIATAWNSTPKKIPRVIYDTGSGKNVYRLVDIDTTLQNALFTAVTGGGLWIDSYIGWMKCDGTLSPAWSKGSITVGKYSKPSGGIPKTDLASAVQTSLGKADTALQSAPVTSVNSKTGPVTLDASDVGAIESPATGTVGQVLKKTADGVEWANESGGGSSIDPYASNPAALGTASPGSSDDYARGDHVHPKPTAADIGAIAAPGSPSEGNVLTYSSGAWAATAPSGLTSAIKIALLQIAEKVAYIDGQGQTYYNDLMAALYPVASISAVFTQGANVIWASDSLDVLRQYLVVTATFEDSTTATITGYTLSGTLTEGTSTITASYQGKTDTFTVTVTNDVLYELATPFTSTGSNSVDTGVAITSNAVTTLLIDATIDSFSSAIKILWSNRSASETNYHALQTQLSSSKRYTWGCGLGWSAGQNFVGDGQQLRFVWILYKNNPFSYKWAAKNVTSGNAQNGSGTDSTAYTNSSTIHLGKYGNYDGFSGTINSFKVLRREITDDEIAAFLADGA